MIRPTFEEFRALLGRGNVVPVWAEVLADFDTPPSAFLKVARGEYAFLLESVEGGEKWGRYSFIGTEPSIVFRSKGDRVELVEDGGVSRWSGDPLEGLRRLLGRYKPVPVEGLPRFCGGAVGYLSYDIVRFIERLPDRTVDDLGVWDSVFLITDTLLAFDNVSHRIKVVSNAFVSSPQDAERAYAQAVDKVRQMVERLRRPLDLPAGEGRHAAPGEASVEFTSNFRKADFLEAVRRTKDYIRAGDIIQAVISQRWARPLTVEPFDLYRALRVLNPSPYMFYLKMEDVHLVGSSPEVMVRLEGDRVESRPIAGTRPRGRDEAADERLRRELLADPKERAEHIMLVDLARNDLGRVAEVGTVKVDELMTVEKYSHVMHIVSNVVARLKPGKDAVDVLKATFPAGTLSGAPKVRAMEIIEEIEPTRRGPYGGAVGYVSFTGNMDTCITIRTFLVKGDKIYVQAGAGIVADSEPEREYEETVNKVKALLRAVEMAAGGL